MSIQVSLQIGLGITLLASAAMHAAPLARNPAASPLSTARTVQVHETLLRAGNDGKLGPSYSINVRIERPNKVKLVVAPVMGRKGSDIYVSDGSTDWEYDGGTNKYQITVLAPGEKSKASVRGVTIVNFLMNGGHFPAPDKGVHRTITPGMLDGKAVTITTDSESIKMADGETKDIVGKMWIDARSRLPYRILASITSKGMTSTIEDLKFSNWVFDKPIPAAQLAWTPPAGAKLFENNASTLLAVGAPAPDFSAVTPDGKTVHLSDYQGKTVVLDFWATWCGPCQASMPHLEQVYQQVKDKDVVVLGVCVWDQKDAYDKWISTKSSAYTFQTAFDPAGHGAQSIASALYKVTGIPTQYVIDKNGKVAAAYSGYDAKDARLEKALIAQGVTLSAPTKAVAATP